MIIHLANKLNLMSIQRGFYGISKISGFAARNFGCNPQRYLGCFCGADSNVRSLFRSEAA